MIAIKQRNKNKEIKEIVLNKYNELVDSGIKKPSATKIVNETGLDYAAVARIMKQEGLMSSSYNRCKLETLEEGSRLAEGAYNMGAYASFGYGPNAGTTKDGTWTRIYSKQVETNTALSIDASLRQHFNQNAGSIMQYYIPTNTRARNELKARNKGSKSESKESTKLQVWDEKVVLLTNFDKNLEHIYQKAMDLCGRKELFISPDAYDCDGNKVENLSALNVSGPIKTSELYKIFDQFDEALEQVQKEMLSENEMEM